MTMETQAPDVTGLTIWQGWHLAATLGVSAVAQVPLRLPDPRSLGRPELEASTGESSEGLNGKVDGSKPHQKIAGRGKI